jgi:phosphoglycerate kinase
MNTLEKLPKIQDVDLKDKIVLVRVDHNVVKNGKIHDPYRIDMTLGTLFHIYSKGGKIILMTHVGRPRNKKTGEIEISEKTSVMPIVEYLKNKLHINIAIPEFYKDEKKGYLSVDASVNHLIKDLRNNKIDAIYLPNTRWFYGEEAGGEDALRFARQLAGLADVYVNDAFGSWQPHASTALVNEFLPSYAGFLMQKEIQNLQRIYDAKKPFLAVVAGSKFDTKIGPLFALLEKADHLIIGGVIYNAYLAAKYGLKIKGVSDEDIEQAHKFIEYSQKFPGKIIELNYVVESDTLDGRIEGKYRTLSIDDLKKKKEINYILDAAKESFEDEKVKQVFGSAATIFVNAVMGFAPHFNEGTIALDELIDTNKDAMKLYGGGDTMQELKRLLPGLYMSAIDNPKYYIFTGGGAVLKAIEGGSPEGIEPIKRLINGKNK